jgi:hypothetical protein
LTGVAFAGGWTRCVGPTLAATSRFRPAAQARARAPSSSPSIRSGSTCLPDLRARLHPGRSPSLAVSGVTGAVGVTSGALLVAFGVLLAAGQLFQLTIRLARFTGLSI